MQKLPKLNSVFSNKSQILIPQSKANILNSFLLMTRQYKQSEIACFLAGYVIGQLRVSPLSNDCSKIIKKLDQAIDLVKQQTLQKRNVFQSIIETISSIKQAQQNKSKFHIKSSKNRMVSQYQSEMEVQKQQKSETFLQYFTYTLQQVMIDRNILKNKWNAQKFREDEQRKNQQAIKKMIEEQQKQYNQMRKLQNRHNEEEDQKYVRKLMQEQKIMKKQQQQQPLQCQICLVDIDYADLGTLSCGHIFHRECLYQHIKSAVNSNKIQMHCPMEQCKSIISITDIQQYLDGDILDKYNKFSLNKYVQMNNKDTSWCPTAGCSALFEFDQALDNYRCPACKKHYCLRCRCDYHYKMTCAEYRVNNTWSEADQSFEKFVRGAKFKQCPKCNFWVERSHGCSSMACRCGIQFCYDCGGTGCPMEVAMILDAKNDIFILNLLLLSVNHFRSHHFLKQFYNYFTHKINNQLNSYLRDIIWIFL